MRIHAERIIRMREKLNAILSQRTGQPLEKIARDTDRDRFMEPEEAVEYGLIDAVIRER